MYLYMFAFFLCPALAEFAGFRVKECFAETANTDVYVHLAQYNIVSSSPLFRCFNIRC